MIKKLERNIYNCKECPFGKLYFGTTSFKCTNPKCTNKEELHTSPIYRIPSTCPLNEAREPGVQAGVAVILINDQQQILVGQRKNSSSGTGHWGLPGGGMIAGETPREAVVREIAEETNITIKNPDIMEFATFTNDSFIEESGEHWITLYFLCRQDNFTGKAVIVEPDKCAEWRWVDLDNIPTPIFCNWAKDLDKLKAMVLLEGKLHGTYSRLA